MLIQKYTSHWPQDFVAIKNEIDKGLAGLAYTIEHIGSTAVPQLDAKPIIDIDIVYVNDSEFEGIKSGLMALGYHHTGNQGIEDREVFKRSGGYFNAVLDTIPHHLYVCPQNSIAFESHILLRDFLRINKPARLEYQQMKYQLAEEAQQDKKRYAELKAMFANDFMAAIIKQAKSGS